MWTRNLSRDGKQPETRQRTQQRVRQERAKIKEAENLYRNFKDELKRVPRLDIDHQRKVLALHELREEERKRQGKNESKIYEEFKSDINATPRNMRNSD